MIAQNRLTSIVPASTFENCFGILDFHILHTKIKTGFFLIKQKSTVMKSLYNIHKCAFKYHILTGGDMDLKPCVEPAPQMNALPYRMLQLHRQHSYLGPFHLAPVQY